MTQIGKKIVIESAGSYEKLQVKEFPIPLPGQGEVVIACKAAGVNFADCCVRMGVYSSAKEFVGWPITPGFEISGTIESIGEGVEGFTLGQKVIALTFFGGYTSHLLVDARYIFPLPDNLSFEEGAAFPAIFLTAAYALQELAHPRPGEKILVHSAAGGVGSALVQLGKLAGCSVAGVVGASHKSAAVKELGADSVIDKSTQDLWKAAEQFAPKGFDIILDANGPETLWQSYKHLTLGGRLVVYGFHTMLSKGRGTPNWLKVMWDYLTTPRFNPMHMTNDNHSVLAFNLSYLFGKDEIFRELMQRLLDLLESGKLHLPRLTTYPLAEVARAHRDLESGQTIGKLILVI